MSIKICFLVEDEKLVKEFDKKMDEQNLNRTQGLTELMKYVVAGKLSLRHRIEVSS